MAQGLDQGEGWLAEERLAALPTLLSKELDGQIFLPPPLPLPAPTSSIGCRRLSIVGCPGFHCSCQGRERKAGWEEVVPCPEKEGSFPPSLVEAGRGLTES